MHFTFIVVRVGIQVEGVWRHAIGVWPLPNAADEKADDIVVKTITGVIDRWFKAQTGGVVGGTLCYHDVGEVSVSEDRAVPLLADCLLTQPDSVQRFKKCNPPRGFRRNPPHV